MSLPPIDENEAALGALAPNRLRRVGVTMGKVSRQAPALAPHSDGLRSRVNPLFTKNPRRVPAIKDGSGPGPSRSGREIREQGFRRGPPPELRRAGRFDVRAHHARKLGEAPLGVGGRHVDKEARQVEHNGKGVEGIMAEKGRAKGKAAAVAMRTRLAMKIPRVTRRMNRY